MTWFHTSLSLSVLFSIPTIQHISTRTSKKHHAFLTNVLLLLMSPKLALCSHSLCPPHLNYHTYTHSLFLCMCPSPLLILSLDIISSTNAFFGHSSHFSILQWLCYITNICYCDSPIISLWIPVCKYRTTTLSITVSLAITTVPTQHSRQSLNVCHIILANLIPRIAN